MRKMVLLTILVFALLAGGAMAADLTPIGQSCTAGAPLLTAAAAQTVPLFVFPTCGACSAGCSNAKLGTQCGNMGGRIEFCQNDGTTCAQDGKPHCVCTAQPIE